MRQGMKRVALAWLASWMLLPMAAGAQDRVDLAPYLRKDQFERVKISPTGEYFAATVPLEDRTGLAVVRRSDNSISAKIIGKRDSVVADFWWANDERILVSLAQKLGSRDQPVVIGELHAINADGSRGRLLGSPYGVDEEGSSGNRIRTGLEQALFLADILPGDQRNVLVSATPIANEPNIRLEKLDIYTRRRLTVATAPVRRADFTVDHAGTARFALGYTSDNYSRLYYRDDDKADWRLVNDEMQSKRDERPLGFSADGSIAYLQVDTRGGPDVIMSWDPKDGRYAELLSDPKVNPYRIIYDLDGRTPVGASFMSDRVRNRFFDENAPTARLYRSLEKSFKDEAIYITSATADRQLALIYAWSDRNNGDYFLFDIAKRKANRLFGRREWLNPGLMNLSREVNLKARDGLPLQGYLTLPSTSGPAPMVVMPHGGPFGIFDEWEFNDDAQILADAGYAVLRINYRGSGNHGRAFKQGGAREWGGLMQDDVTDATRWAIEQGIAQRDRICIYGASYGGYAALMGVAKEPDLYRCAAGYVGVYDLPMMYRQDANRSGPSKVWVEEWVGTPDGLAAHSPVNLADRIKVPVFLAAGGKDEIAPMGHSTRMEKALKKAGVPVETLYYPTEGHGFYTEPHRREYYTQLLAFLSRHLGGKTAK